MPPKKNLSKPKTSKSPSKDKPAKSKLTKSTKPTKPTKSTKKIKDNEITEQTESESDVNTEEKEDEIDEEYDVSEENELEEENGEIDDEIDDEIDEEEEVDDEVDDEKKTYNINDIEITTKIDEDQLSKKTRIRKIIPPNERKMSDRMTRFELANIMANRAKHIQMGAEILIDIENIDNEEDIVKKELETINPKTGKSNCELYVSRYSHSDDQYDYYEEWYIHEMILPKT